MLSAIRQNTSMDTMLPAIDGNRRMSRLLAQLVFILAGGTLLAASPQFNVMVPPSPVPITGQTLVVLMIGMAFGPRLGAITILAYILAGLCGLPVFAGGGAGVSVLVGPSGGYLVGFVAAAFVIGLLTQRGMDRSILRIALAIVVGTLVICFFGFAWLASLIGMGKAFLFGIQPYLWADAMKLVVAASLMPAAWRGVRAVERMYSDGRG